MSVSMCRSRWLYDQPHKSERICALLVLHGARARVCGGGGGIFMRQQGTPLQMIRFVSPNPNPVTISP